MKSILQNFQSISLDEMSGVKLLNRTDTKFVTSLNQLRKLLSMAEHDYRVQEINGQRIAHYYSTYFDTPTNDMYMRHQNGHQNRQKLRIRSYVDSHLNFLEVKTKNNHGRTKKSVSLLFSSILYILIINFVLVQRIILMLLLKMTF